MDEPNEQDKKLADELWVRAHEGWPMDEAIVMMARYIATFLAPEREEASRSEERAILWEDRWQKSEEEGFKANLRCTEAGAENARLTAEVERLTRIEKAARAVCDNPIWGVGVIAGYEEMDELNAALDEEAT